jgi:zinc transport system ATP-binding protein
MDVKIAPKKAQLKCIRLTLGYDGEELLKGLDFAVYRGDYLYILGENGSGKTTLMKAVLGLIKPLSGSIVYGDSVDHRSIGYLPQKTVIQQDFPATVWEIVLSGFEGRRGLRLFYTREEKAEALSWLGKMNISALKDKCFRELSGGQQQRVLLARALCATGKILLLDEPVAGLDPQAQEEMYRVINGLHKDGVTVIMISHDVHAALLYATHILHVGEETFFGTREEYLESTFGKHFIEAEEKAAEGSEAKAYSADYRPKEQTAASEEECGEAKR